MTRPAKNLGRGRTRPGWDIITRDAA